jgi:signal transduction histidine kinase
MCAQSYDPKDMAFCTFYARPICSLCCSLDAHCHDACKRPARQAAMQASRGLRPFFAERVAPHMGRRLAQVSGVLFALAAITAVVFLLTFEVLALGAKPYAMDNESLLTRLYLAVLPLLAVAAWWIVLARESRDLAERDLVASLERLREAEHELAKSERLAAIGEIAATVSHELRNPLGTLISSVAVLRHAAGEMPAQEQTELARIERNVWRCTRIIEDLLEFSRVREPVRRPIAIDAWIAEQLADHPGIEAVQVRRRLRAAATVRIDPERLRQALANVLANARGAEREPEGKIAVSTRREGRWLVIEVGDNGCGMSDEVRRRIFEPLFSSKAFGVGLGMALVRRTMEQQGGEVTVQSSPGCGATVTMRLPLLVAE